MFNREKPETAQRTAETGEQTGYMAELDLWLETTVFEPIREAVAKGDAKELHLALSEGKQLLKRMRLELPVAPDGNPKLNFLDENGKVIYSLPEDAKAKK